MMTVQSNYDFQTSFSFFDFSASEVAFCFSTTLNKKPKTKQQRPQKQKQNKDNKYSIILHYIFSALIFSLLRQLIYLC